MPDCLYPTDNQYGIPSLLLDMQAEQVDLPFIAWGSVSRMKTRNPGSWHFYVDDYRFENLWKRPERLLETECRNAVEPNFSIYQQTPVAVSLWQIYRKRWIARYWQEHGLRVFVDLNVARLHMEDNLLGVPAGWRSFCTRGYSERTNATLYEYEMAKAIAGIGKNVLFVVYGGGKKVQQLCMDNGFVWIPEQEEVAKERN